MDDPKAYMFIADLKRYVFDPHFFFNNNRFAIFKRFLLQHFIKILKEIFYEFAGDSYSGKLVGVRIGSINLQYK